MSAFGGKADMILCGNPLAVVVGGKADMPKAHSAGTSGHITQSQCPDMAVPLFWGSIADNPSHKIFAFLSQCEDGHIAPVCSVLTIQSREERGCIAPKAVHCPHRDRGPPRCWGQGARAQARLAQKLFDLRQGSDAQRHEEFSERAAATVMSAIGP
jgi:hypothetical protein